MRINPIGFKVFNNNQQIRNNFQISRLKVDSFDSVCFRGIQKEDEEEISPKDTGIKIGKSMLKLDREGKLDKDSVSRLMNSNSKHEIEIFDMKDFFKRVNMPYIPGQVVAYMQPYYDENFNFLSAELFIDGFNRKNTPMEQCELIANSAHEFTHILQRAKNKDMNGFLKYFNDMNKYQIISRVGFQAIGEVLNIEMGEIVDNEEKYQKAKEEIEKGEFDFRKYAKDLDLIAQVFRIGFNVAQKSNYNLIKTEVSLLEWIYNTARDEQEAYDVTLAVYNECDDADEDKKIRRTITKEIYKYIADELQPAFDEMKNKKL